MPPDTVVLGTSGETSHSMSAGLLNAARRPEDPREPATDPVDLRPSDKQQRSDRIEQRLTDLTCIEWLGHVLTPASPH